MPEGMLEQMPLHQDGLLLWNAIKEYVSEYLKLYPETTDDDAVSKDADCVRFWAHFETQLDTPWHLPDLTHDRYETYNHA